MKTVILLLLIGLVAVSADVWWEFKRYSTNDCSGEPIQTLEKDSCNLVVNPTGIVDFINTGQLGLNLLIKLSV